jgi:tellurite resistance protein
MLVDQAVKKELKEIICTLFVAQTLCLHSAAFSAQNNEIDSRYKERLSKQHQSNWHLSQFQSDIRPLH